MYHDLAEDLDGIPVNHHPYVLNPVVFRSQLEAVALSSLRVVSVAEWCSQPKSTHGLVLTFDDGNVSNHTLALPILLEYGFKATFFITVGQIGIGNTMDWSQIRNLHAAGMEIGSHTLTHRPPSTLNDNELPYELSESRRILEDGLGAPVNSISSPTGFFNPRMGKVAREVGYRSLCIGRVGLVSDHADPFALNRVAIKRAMAEQQFKKLLRFDLGAIAALRSQQWTKDLARRIVGPERYLQVRKILMKRFPRAGSAFCL
jgi:peptidoglycan/xylan/chitin deacetylase (PgdA/CDA1 family)